MSASVQLGLLLALATAFTSILGFLYKHRGAGDRRRSSCAARSRSSLALFRSRWYVLGMVVAMGSWGLHVGALALAPISLVQTAIAGGLVLLTVVADRLFGHAVTRREWIGVALTARRPGVPRCDPRRDGADRRTRDYAPATLVVYVGRRDSGRVCGAAVWRATRPGGTLLAASAGLHLGRVGRLDQGAQRQHSATAGPRCSRTRSRW